MGSWLANLLQGHSPLLPACPARPKSQAPSGTLARPPAWTSGPPLAAQAFVPGLQGHDSVDLPSQLLGVAAPQDGAK